MSPRKKRANVVESNFLKRAEIVSCKGIRAGTAFFAGGITLHYCQPLRGNHVIGECCLPFRYELRACRYRAIGLVSTQPFFQLLPVLRCFIGVQAWKDRVQLDQRATFRREERRRFQSSEEHVAQALVAIVGVAASARSNEVNIFLKADDTFGRFGRYRRRCGARCWTGSCLENGKRSRWVGRWLGIECVVHRFGVSAIVGLS